MSVRRVKRMNRQARLASARHWLPTYTGKNVAAGYRKWFGVDWQCAFRELEILGVPVDGAYREGVLQAVATGIQERARRRDNARADALGASHEVTEDDAEFEFIAGCTEAGFPYGVPRTLPASHGQPPSAVAEPESAEDEIPW